MTVMRYAIVIERAEGNFRAYVPDLPGCISTGTTIDEVKGNIREAIELRLEGLRDDGEPIPQHTTVSDYVEIKVA
jgi:predicted RNase H-like HicB family nuclease